MKNQKKMKKAKKYTTDGRVILCEFNLMKFLVLVGIIIFLLCTYFGVKTVTEAINTDKVEFASEQTIEEHETENEEETKAIFIDGNNGDDANNGLSCDCAVKTFKVAKEKLEEEGYDTIYVVDTIQVTDEEHWDLDGKTLKRYKTNEEHTLVQVAGGKLYLSNIIIDGGSEDNIKVSNNYNTAGKLGVLVCLSDGSYLEINKGTSLQNNENNYCSGISAGAVYVSDSEIVMNDGQIVNNKGCMGAGILLRKNATMTMNGGTIKKNETIHASGEKNALVDGVHTGGGVCLYGDGNKLIMNDGVIENNKACDGYGGGVSIGRNMVMDSEFIMYGGTIKYNIAGCGGGIFAQAGGVVKIYGGNIINNEATGTYMNGTAECEATFAGGGIYINGDSNTGTNATLYLYNAIVRGNTSESYGGGLASCPRSITKIYANEGVAIYNNNADKGAEDIYITSNESSNATGEISENMLGGGKNNWTYGKGSDEEGELIPLEDLKNFTEINAKNGANDGSIESAENYAKVIISGNKSGTSGGGIGSNGTIILGEQEELQNLEVEKTWIDYENADNTRPEEITVNLKVDETVIDSKTLSEDNSWKCTFENLCTSYKYQIEEVPIEDYTTEYENEYDTETGMLVKCNITNAYTTNVNILVNKTWEDYNNADNTRPESITVNLLQNGIKIDSKELTENDGWCYTFENLEKYDENYELYTYSVTENTVENYNTEITGNQEKGYVITNTYTTSTDISGTKIWVDYEDKYKLRPEEVIVKLLQNGEVMLDDDGNEVTKIITAEDDWNYQFTDLEKYDDNDESYVYTVEEEKVDNYIATYDENNNIINTLIDGTYKIVLVKTNEAGATLENVVFTVNGENYITDENGIINIVEENVITKANVEIPNVFEITEKQPLDGYKLYDGTITLTVTKKKAENGDEYIVDKVSLDETSEKAENIKVEADGHTIIISMINEKEEVITPIPNNKNEANPITNEPNPITGDMIIIVVAILVIALLGLIMAVIIRKELRNR